MTEPYTPTTEEVRARIGSGWGAPYRDELRRDFDRWLAQHDREVAAGELKEAAKELAPFEDLDTTIVVGGEGDEGWVTVLVSDWLTIRADRIERSE